MAGVAFFDIDKTLWPRVGEKALALHLIANGGLALHQFAKIIGVQMRHDLHLIDTLDTAKRKILSDLFAGRAVAPSIDVCATLFESDWSRSFFPDMLAQVDRHRRAGDKIVVVSATIDVIARQVAAFLKADACYATVLEMRQGLYSGEVLGPIPFGPAKAGIVMDYARSQGIELDRCYAYGDHWEDRHMLKIVGHPVAINPDKKLLRHARRHNWETRILTPPRFSRLRRTGRSILNQTGRSA
ncbi:HAD family hydrolase [Segnochrobactrum spirostomi]|nr:HAD family phosphatase [Segnochrobactrum spirostomi]